MKNNVYFSTKNYLVFLVISIFSISIGIIDSSNIKSTFNDKNSNNSNSNKNEITNTNNEKLQSELASLYLKEQPEIDFFKQNQYLESKKQNKSKKPFILEKEIKEFSKDSSKYLANHNNKELFMTVFGNYTNIKDSKEILSQYLKHRENRFKKNKDLLIPKEDSGFKNITEWNFDFNKYEYTLPSDSKIA